AAAEFFAMAAEVIFIVPMLAVFPIHVAAVLPVVAMHLMGTSRARALLAAATAFGPRAGHQSPSSSPTDAAVQYTSDNTLLLLFAALTRGKHYSGPIDLANRFALLPLVLGSSRL